MRSLLKLLFHFVLMFIISVLIFWGIVWGLNRYTRQDEIIKVPELKGYSVDEAIEVLKERSLVADVVDSIYQKGEVPNTIYDVVPEEGESVKPGRKIFLKKYCLYPNKVVIPEIQDLPIRAARERLKRLGFDNIQEREVEGIHKDLCVGLELLGDTVRIKAGERLALDSQLVLLVSGKKSEDISLDDLISSDTVVPASSSDSVSQLDPVEEKPEDWF